MAFTAKDVATLRQKTGCGMMDCKKALTEADGDMDKAIDILREMGVAKTIKKASRIAAEDVAVDYQNDNSGVALEVNAETDFVAKNADFQAFVKTVADTVLAENPADVADLLTKKAVGTEMTVAELLQEKIQTIGENIIIRRFVRYEGTVATYIHMGGKIAVMVQFDTDVADKDGFVTYAKDVAMQIAALNTQYLDAADVPADVIEHEKEIMIAQMKQDPKMANKPEQVLAKIVDGKVGKFYKENCLVDQEFVKDNSKTIGSYTKETEQALCGSIKSVKFGRFEKGEGLEKRADDFAAEVAAAVKG